jgi:MmyB-like transcription regulator ligand binding domain
VLAWNQMAAALLGDLSSIPPRERNTARRAFIGSPMFIGAHPDDRARLRRALVTDLRRSAARYPDDPGMRTLIADLRAASAEFAQLWELRTLNERHGDRKRLVHPELGELVLDCDVLHLRDDDQTLLVYSAAPGSREAQALELLRVVGLQKMDEDRLRSAHGS